MYSHDGDNVNKRRTYHLRNSVRTVLFGLNERKMTVGVFTIIMRSSESVYECKLVLFSIVPMSMEILRDVYYFKYMTTEWLQ